MTADIFHDQKHREHVELCTFVLNKEEENGGGKDARAIQYLPPD